MTSLPDWARLGGSVPLVLVEPLPPAALQQLEAAHHNLVLCQGLQHACQWHMEHPGHARARAILAVDTVDCTQGEGAAEGRNTGRTSGAIMDRQLGRACRQFPGGVLALVPQAPDTAPSKCFFAFGFQRWRHPIRLSEASWAVFEYSLRDYKRAPDWLNARYWANPERFDLPE